MNHKQFKEAKAELGYTNAQLAIELGLSVRMVEYYSSPEFAMNVRTSLAISNLVTIARLRKVIEILEKQLEEIE